MRFDAFEEYSHNSTHLRDFGSTRRTDLVQERPESLIRWRHPMA
jgi:hypothetical protein